MIPPTRLAGLLLLAALIAALGYGAWQWRQGAVSNHPQLPVRFDHADHTHTPCADCHHNFTDRTGSGPCYSCHKFTPEIAADMEPMFHDFCRGCHLRVRLRGEEAGPLRQCGECHQ